MNCSVLDPAYAILRVGNPPGQPLYDRDKLSAGLTFPGPALVMQLDATTLIHDYQRVTCDRFGNLIAEMR